jgi:C4-type Zn-finger protein
MIWKPCSGIGQPAMKSEEYGGRAMCPVCTRYVRVSVGEPCPHHDAVVINSQSENGFSRHQTLGTFR